MLEHDVLTPVEQIEARASREVLKAKLTGLFVMAEYKSLPKNLQNQCLSVDDGIDRFYRMVKGAVDGIYSAHLHSPNFNPQMIPEYSVMNRKHDLLNFGFLTKVKSPQSVGAPMKYYALTEKGKRVLDTMINIDKTE